jgi:hypothetical protein
MVTLNEISQKHWQENNLEHLRYEYDLKPEDTVLDIGSYRREFADEIIKRYGCKVECFDALDNRAAWIYDGELKMGGQFYYTSMYDNGELGEVKTYKCVDIAKFIDKEIALMKVNIEGGEYELLKYIYERNLLRSIKNIQVQFHLIDNDEFTYKYINCLLKQTHKLTWQYEFCWENWERK